VYNRKILHVHAQWSRQQSEKRIRKLSGESLKQMDIPGVALAFAQTQRTQCSMPELWHYRTRLPVQWHSLYSLYRR